MTDTSKKPSNFNVKLDEDEEAAMVVLEGRDPYKSLSASRRAIIRMALILLAKENVEEAKPATRGDMKELREEMHGFAAAFRAVGKAGAMLTGAVPVEKPARANAKTTDEEKDAVGALVCESLGGVVAGRSCRYMKYEKLPTGRPASYEVTEPLIALSDATLATQYSPSRDEYESAVKDWKDD